MRKVEATIDIAAPPDTVTRAFMDEQMLRDWWQAERTLIEPRPGGLYTLVWNIAPTGFGFVSSGLIKTYEPGSTLQIDKLVYLNPQYPPLGPMTMTIQATDKGDATTLYLCQEGYGEGPACDWYYEAVKSAWPQVLQTLKAYLENKKS